MEERRTSDDFEDLLRKRFVPEFDENEMICRIQAAKDKRSARSKIRIVLLAAVLLLMMISSIAYGDYFFKPFKRIYNVLSSTALKDEDGKTLFEKQIVEYSKDELDKFEEVRSIYQAYEKTMAQHKYELKQDEVEVFIIVDAYKIDGSFRPLYKDKRFNHLEELIKNSSIKFKTPDLLPDKYRFKYGLISNHKIPVENWGGMVDQLYNKALNEGMDYITQKFKASDEVSEIQLHYSENNGYNEITISIGGAYKSFSRDTSSKVEIIEINGREAVYTSNDEKKYSSRGEIIFVDHNGTEDLTYTVRFPLATQLYSDMVPQVVKMIESMLE